MVFAVAAAVACAAGLASADSLSYIRAGGRTTEDAAGNAGAAWLFNRGGVCYAATPKHVLQKGPMPEEGYETYAAFVFVRPGRPSIPAQGDLCAMFPDHDLAIMTVTGYGDLSDCGQVLAAQPGIDGLLAMTTEASILSPTQAGSFNRKSLTIRNVNADDGDHFRVTPKDKEEDRIGEGMSGSMVSIRDQPSGFLLAVGEGRSGEQIARVLRLDRAVPLMVRAFENASLVQTENPACLRAGYKPPVAQPRDAATSMRTILSATGQDATPTGGGRASAGCGARVLSWSTPPLGPESRPEALIDGMNETAWRTQTDDGQTTLDIALCNAQGGSVSRVTLDASDCAEGDNSGLQVEVLLRTGSGATAASFASGRLPAGGKSVELVSGVPLLAQQVRLRIVADSASAGPVCLARFSAE